MPDPSEPIVTNSTHFPMNVFYAAHMKDVVLARLGQSLKELRLRRGLTQQQAGDLARMPREKVVRLEQGRGSTAIEAYVALAHALGAELALAPTRRPTIEEITKVLADD